MSPEKQVETLKARLNDKARLGRSLTHSGIAIELPALEKQCERPIYYVVARI